MGQMARNGHPLRAQSFSINRPGRSLPAGTHTHTGNTRNEIYTCCGRAASSCRVALPTLRSSVVGDKVLYGYSAVYEYFGGFWLRTREGIEDVFRSSAGGCSSGYGL